MASATDDLSARMSSTSGSRSRDSRRQNPQQQLSQIEKSVTHLLVATKQLLETLTHWSRGTATESEVSDVYVRLGYEFNIACRTFNAIGVDTNDLGPVPDLLRTILEETLSQEASQSSLERYLPRIRDIVINLLHGLKAKQERLRQRTKKDRAMGQSTSGRADSLSSNTSADGVDGPTQPPPPSRQSSSKSVTQRRPSTDLGDAPDLPPPRTSGSVGRGSPTRRSSLGRGAGDPSAASRDTLQSDSSMSSTTAQALPVVPPYPQEETMPGISEASPPPYSGVTDFPHPPPPPPKQQDALAALQRGGELERRASRRFSQYQINKQLGGAVAMIPPIQNSPIPNRGRDVQESMNAVRSRNSQVFNVRQGASARANNASPIRRNDTQRIAEDSSRATPPSIKPPSESVGLDSPTIKTPEDKLGPTYVELDGRETVRAAGSMSGSLSDPTSLGNTEQHPPRVIPRRSGSRKAAPPSPPTTSQYMPEQSPPPGKELILFLQYKSKVKKIVLEEGYNDLSIGRLQLAFIEKFNWNTHSNGLDLPDIYVQDPVSGVRHELEDLSDVKDRAVLVLNVEALDEVKKHIDDGIGGLRRVVEDMRSVMQAQQASLDRVSDKQQEAVKEIASLAAAPRVPTGLPSPPISSVSQGQQSSLRTSASQLSEVQSLRRDLAVVRQTYTSFVADLNASMAAIRTKAKSVKQTAVEVAIPTLKGDTGRAYVNNGKKTLSDESEKIVSRVDEVQDAVEDLRKDVVLRGVRPLPRQLDQVTKDIALATSEVRKMKEFLKREKPLWTKIWEHELQVVCEERDLLTMQEELAADLEDDLEKAAQTFSLVEQATKQQMQSGPPTPGQRVPSNHSLKHVDVDPRKAKDGVLDEVRALQPNHETRLDAIERAEKARQRELESRRGGEFQKELGSFVEEGRLQKTGGHEEVDRLRKAKDERIRREVWERQQARAARSAEGIPAPPATTKATVDSTIPLDEAKQIPVPEGDTAGLAN